MIFGSPVSRTYGFRDSTHRHTQAVALTDGGVYDNLALSPLLPGRSARFTSHVYELDYIIAVDAGRGRAHHSTGSFVTGRLKRSVDITYNKTQDGVRAQLHAAAEHQRLRGFVHAYLAMPDHKLPVPLADVVPQSAVVAYPTNFAAMSADDEYHLTTRGEQLIRLLLGHHCPELAG